MIHRLHLLVSHAYLRKNDAFLQLMLGLNETADTLIDCGAFTNAQALRKSAKTGEAPDLITLEEYIARCHEWYEGRCWQYIAMDVVKDPDASFVNLDKMTDSGLRPMPVFVEGMPWQSVTDRLLPVNEYLCVAGGVGSRKEYAWQRYQRVAAQGAKVHALGFVRWPDIMQLPIRTTDSSSFNGGALFGTVARFEGRSGLTNAPLKSALASRDEKFTRHLLDCNVPLARLADGDYLTGNQSASSHVTLNAYLNLHHFAERGARAYFFACGTVNWICQIAAVVSTKVGKLFDYELSRQRAEHLLSLSTSDKVAEISAIFKAHTRWQEKRL